MQAFVDALHSEETIRTNCSQVQQSRPGTIIYEPNHLWVPYTQGQSNTLTLFHLFTFTHFWWYFQCGIVFLSCWEIPLFGRLPVTRYEKILLWIILCTHSFFLWKSKGRNASSMFMATCLQYMSCAISLTRYNISTVTKMEYTYFQTANYFDWLIPSFLFLSLRMTFF